MHELVFLKTVFDKVLYFFFKKVFLKTFDTAICLILRKKFFLKTSFLKNYFKFSLKLLCIDNKKAPTRHRQKFLESYPPLPPPPPPPAAAAAPEFFHHPESVSNI